MVLRQALVSTGVALLSLAAVGTAVAQTQPPAAQGPAGYGGPAYDPYAQQPPPGYAPPAGYPPAQQGYPPPNYQQPPAQQPPPNGYPQGYPPPQQGAQQPAYPPSQGYPPPGYAPPPPGYAPPPPGYAPPPQGYMPAVAGYRQHDGFYFNLRLGPSYLSLGNENFRAYGWGASFGLSLGGALTPNLVIFGDLTSMAVSDPSYSAAIPNPRYQAQSSSLVGIGLGAAYYVVPANAFVSATLSTSKGYLSGKFDPGLASEVQLDDETHFGIMTRLSVGKEWWMGSDWAFGVAAEAALAHMSVPDIVDPDGTVVSASAINAKQFGLVLSLTCN